MLCFLCVNNYSLTNANDSHMLVAAEKTGVVVQNIVWLCSSTKKGKLSATMEQYLRVRLLKLIVIGILWQRIEQRVMEIHT